VLALLRYLAEVDAKPGQELCGKYHDDGELKRGRGLPWRPRPGGWESGAAAQVGIQLSWGISCSGPAPCAAPESAARSLKVESIAAPVHSEAEIEQVITSLGRELGGGLIVSADGFMFINRALIISSTARNKVATVYQFSVYVREGGLLSYGPNFGDIYRRAAPYVDRILRGTKPAELPVQLPVKFEMVLNAKTAKALGLTIPQSILLRADDVIE
jgi:ABC transporter substrate binding protein